MDDESVTSSVTSSEKLIVAVQMTISPCDGDDSTTSSYNLQDRENLSNQLSEIIQTDESSHASNSTSSSSSSIHFQELLNAINNSSSSINRVNYDDDNSTVSSISVPIQNRRIDKYNKSGRMSIFDECRDVNTEFRILNLLNYLVINHQTPHILLPIEKMYTGTSLFIDSADDNVSNRNYKKFVKHGDDYDKLCSVIFMEYFPLGTVSSFIKENIETLDDTFWKNLFFQLLSVFATIQLIYPTFRHNDLKLNNVLLKETKADVIDRYEINGKSYDVKSNGYSVILYDFDFSSITGVIDNHKVELDWCNDIGINPDTDHYFDIHFFFNCLNRGYWFGKDIWNEKYISKETLDFVSRVVPDEHRKGKHISEKGRIINGVQHTTPLQLIENDEYFAEFRVNEINKLTSLVGHESLQTLIPVDLDA